MTCCEMVFKQGRKRREEKKTGLSGMGEYKIWANILCRCRPVSEKPVDIEYLQIPHKVCVSWLESYSNFIRDMGPRPSKRHSIDRIDNSKGYCPHNCRWATPFQQSLNRDVTKKKETWPLGVYLNVNGDRYIYRRTLGRKEVSIFESKSLIKTTKVAEYFEEFEKKVNALEEGP